MKTGSRLTLGRVPPDPVTAVQFVAGRCPVTILLQKIFQVLLTMQH
jgi:hypothetical protein